jgi:hypothetical protein
MTAFITSKGSIYRVVDQIKTIRFKEQRVEHGTDYGWKSPSDITVYMNPDDAAEFGGAQGLQPVEEFLVDLDVQLKRVRLLVRTYGKWGVVVGWKTCSKDPEVGKSPLELFDRKSTFAPLPNRYQFDNWHPGNKIVCIGG